MRMLLPLLRCWKKKTDDAERINKVKQNKTHTKKLDPQQSGGETHRQVFVFCEDLIET